MSSVMEILCIRARHFDVVRCNHSSNFTHTSNGNSKEYRFVACYGGLDAETDTILSAICFGMLILATSHSRNIYTKDKIILQMLF